MLVVVVKPALHRMGWYELFFAFRVYEMRRLILRRELPVFIESIRNSVVRHEVAFMNVSSDQGGNG